VVIRKISFLINYDLGKKKVLIRFCVPLGGECFSEVKSTKKKQLKIETQKALIFVFVLEFECISNAVFVPLGSVSCQQDKRVLGPIFFSN